MAPIAEFYGVPVDAFYDETLAEQLLSDIATGAFVVKSNRRGSAWAPPQQGMATTAPAGVAAAPTLAQALDVLATRIKLAGPEKQENLINLMALLVRNPGNKLYAAAIEAELNTLPPTQTQAFAGKPTTTNNETAGKAPAPRRAGDFIKP